MLSLTSVDFPCTTSQELQDDIGRIRDSSENPSKCNSGLLILDEQEVPYQKEAHNILHGPAVALAVDRVHIGK